LIDQHVPATVRRSNCAIRWGMREALHDALHARAATALYSGADSLPDHARSATRRRAAMRTGALAGMLAGTLAGLRTAALGLAALATAAVGQAQADGAVAVGSTGDVVRDGIAFGMVINEPKEQAADGAMKHCRGFRARAAAERCKVVATFSGECFAVAQDPQTGTPGVGWGIGPDQPAANQKAMIMCQETAGPARRSFCQLESGGCDTTGQREAPKADTKVQSQAPAETPSTPHANKLKAARNTGSPLLPIGAMAGVGIAYALGQQVRGKLKGGIAERQILTGGALAVAAAIVVKLLDMAGADQVVGLVLAGLIALGAALLA
jgi:hypothetical protein